jgi:hypothetical protein
VRFRIGILDITAALIVLVVMVLPARSVTVQPVYGDDPELVREIELAQARLAVDADDGEAAYTLVRHLLEAGQTDWALRVAGNATRLDGQRGSWRALLAISAAHAHRVEIVDAARFARLALEACQATEHDCPSYEEVRLHLYNQQLEAGVRAIERGVDPRHQPAEFREALQAGLRAVRLEAAPPPPQPEPPPSGTPGPDPQ